MKAFFGVKVIPSVIPIIRLKIENISTDKVFGVIMMKKTNFKHIRRNRALIFFLLVIMVSSGMVLVKQELKLQEMSFDQREINQDVKEMQAQVNALESEVEVLDTDASKEALARQKLNMIKKDEILYIVKEKAND